MRSAEQDQTACNCSELTHYLLRYTALDWVYYTKIIDRAMRSAERDQTACMCWLILFYTLCKINSWLGTAGYRFTVQESIGTKIRKVGNTFPNKPLVLCVCSTSLLKTLWEKEKLLVTSNFFFSRCVFYPFEKNSATFMKFKIVVCLLF